MVQMQSGREDSKETIPSFESTAFRYKLEDIYRKAISDEYGKHIMMGLTDRARRCSLPIEPQADAWEALSQILIEEHYVRCSKTVSISASPVDTTS